MHIRKLNRDDIPEVILIANTAFKNDELYAWLFPKQDKYPNDLYRSQLQGLRYRLVKPGCHGFVAVTEGGDLGWSGKPEVTGYAFFERSGNDEAGRQWQQDSLFKKFERYLIGWERSYEATLLDYATDFARCKYYNDLVNYSFYDRLGPQWHVGVLGVSPKFQRRGVGALLVECAQKIAANENIPMTLESSIAAKRLYAKMGFKIVVEVTVVEGLDDNAMVWEPPHLRGKWLENIREDKADLKRAFIE